MIIVFRQYPLGTIGSDGVTYKVEDKGEYMLIQLSKAIKVKRLKQ
jgi:hypothetical protein